MRFIFVYLIVVLGVLSVSSAWKPATGAMKKSFASAALGISILTGAALPSLADGIPSVGQLAPDFTLPSNTGKDISLNDLKDNKFTVIYFYPGDFTSGCTIEAKAFERDFSKYQELGSQILGISVDSVDKHLDFGKKYGLEFPLASDQGGKVIVGIVSNAEPGGSTAGAGDPLAPRERARRPSSQLMSCEHSTP